MRINQELYYILLAIEEGEIKPTPAQLAAFSRLAVAHRTELMYAQYFDDECPDWLISNQEWVDLICETEGHIGDCEPPNDSGAFGFDCFLCDFEMHGYH